MGQILVGPAIAPLPFRQRRSHDKTPSARKAQGLDVSVRRRCLPVFQAPFWKVSQQSYDQLQGTISMGEI